MQLNPPFAKALPELMKTGTAEKRTIEGVGGTSEGDSILLPSVSFQIGAHSVVLSPTHVFTEHGTGTWAAGNMGMDMLKTIIRIQAVAITCANRETLYKFDRAAIRNCCLLAPVDLPW